MQGFSQIGQGAGQYADAQRQMTEQNKPIDPQLEQFARARMRQAIERINAGGDPKMEANNYRNDLANILKSGPGVGAPQVNVPNIVGNTVGPSSPVGNAPAMGGSAFSGNAPVKSMTVGLPQQTDLSGNVPYKPEPQTAPAPTSQPRPQPQPSNRINQTGAPPKQQAPMSRREFEDFSKMNPQFQSMDQIEMTRQSGQNKIQLAEQNNVARAMFKQATEAGLDNRTAATLAFKANQMGGELAVKVFDIMQRRYGINASIMSRERIAAMNKDEKLQYAKLYQRMFADAMRSKTAAMAVGDDEGERQAQAVADMAIIGSNTLDVTNIADGEIAPGQPERPGIFGTSIGATPAIPPKTGPVAKPLPASPVSAPKTGTSTSKSTKTQTRREGLGL
jgi:hypothetical protein